MNKIIFTSVLSADYQTQLQNLMFFNKNQHQVRTAIVGVVERYGVPKVLKENDRLHVRVEALEDVQSLFVLDGDTLLRQRLIGTMVYARTDAETLALLHLAVVGDYAAGGKHAGAMLAVRLIGKLREIAHQIRGVHAISVFYGDEPWLIPVCEPARRI